MESQTEELQLVAVAHELREVARVRCRAGHHELGRRVVVGAHEVERCDHSLGTTARPERPDPDERHSFSLLGHSDSRSPLSSRCSDASWSATSSRRLCTSGGAGSSSASTIATSASVHRPREVVELRAQVGEVAGDGLADDGVDRAAARHLRRRGHFGDAEVGALRDRVEGGGEGRGVAPSLLDALPLLGEIALQIAVTRLDVRHRRAA